MGSRNFTIRQSLEELESIENLFTDDLSGYTQQELLQLIDKIRSETTTADGFLRSLRWSMTLLENTGDIIWQYDEKYNCTFVNGSVSGILGFRPDEFKKFSFEDFLSPHIRKKLSAVRKNGGTNAEGPFKIEKEFADKYHKPVWLESTIIPVFQNGTFLGTIGVSRNITQRKEREEAQNTQEESLRTFIDNLNDLVFEIDENGAFLYLNRKFLDTFGYAPKELRGKPVADFIHSEDVMRVEQNREDQLKNLEQSQDTWRFKHKNGEWRWLECRSSLYKKTDGSIRTLIISSDITERRQSEESIAYERDLLLALINNLPDSVFFKNTRGEFLLANEYVATLMGVKSPSHLKGKTDFDFYPDHIARNFHEDEQKIIKTGKPILNKEEVIKDENEQIYYLTSKVPVKNSEGAIVGIIGIGKDVTDRKKALEVQLESEKKYRFLYENAPIGIFRSTSDGRLVEANPSLAKILGYESVESLLTVTNHLEAQVYTNPVRRSEFVELVSQAGEVENFEIEAFRKDGSVIWLSLNARISQLLDDGNFMIEGFIADITTRKRSEDKVINQNKELTELNATKDKFFSIIAHDLRNPFNGLQALSELLIKNIQEYDKGQILEVLNLIHESAERGVRLLMNLLEWSRAQTGRIEYSPELFDLHELVSDTMALLRNQAAKKNIDVRLDIKPGLQAYADKNMIGTVIRNLISNAIKFTFKEGVVTISASNESDLITIAVSDNGTGISKDHQALLFKLGEHISTKGTANESGTGLGLILCKDFVERNGGAIRVESEYGKGSDFIFTMPAGEKQ